MVIALNAFRQLVVPCACGLLLVLASAQATGAEPVLVFSTRSWVGEYASKDVPGGVETTPVVSAISAIAFDGSGLRTIVSDAEYPTASPDGHWVYYQSKASGDSRIYRCRWDGTGAVCLTPPERLRGLAGFAVRSAYGYALAADGRTMVFTVHDGQTGRMVLADADGSSPRWIAPQLGYTYMGRLSPAGDRVVFSGPARSYRLLTASLPDGQPIELTPDHPESFVPQFTPDGKTIVFVRRDGDVYRVDADGKNLKRLTEGNRYVEFRLSPNDRHGSTDGPDVSPDGKQVAFVARKNGVANVFAMDLDGGNRRQLTTRTAPCGRVRWSPDGKHLAFVSFEGKYPQLFVVPTAGGEPRQLTKLDTAVYFVSWGRVAS